jgi:glycosyl hydrolase family 101 (putative endo-alpha-N-acetylgalactosaminidase)
MPEPVIQWKNDYSKTLTMKIFLASISFQGKYKRRDDGDQEIFLNFEQALEVIKKIDHLTCEMPKIIYLVGWQFSGHDSKYPSWDEVNKKLKRKEDKNALESLRWLINEGKKYHTKVSLHINMFDAYDDSPLWTEYVEKDIIAKNLEGNLIEGECGWPISYAQEFKTGMAQKRIDRLVQMIPEIKSSGTIHIDAFHSWPPLSPKGPISPFLGFTLEEETEAQRQIFLYWAKHNIDVTSEGSGFLRITSFEGYQPMAWWYTESIKNYMKWPANYYCGGKDGNPIRAKLFGRSMHGEPIIQKDPQNLSGFLEEFCLNVIPWQFLNQFERQKYTNLLVFIQVQYSDNIKSSILGKSHRISQRGKLLKNSNDLCIPIHWELHSMIAYSKKGYPKKKWPIPSEWDKIKTFQMYEITINGLVFITDIPIQEKGIELSLKPKQAILLRASI